MAGKVAGHRRAQVAYRTLGTCAECEAAPATDRHHWDGDVLNNAPTNVVPLCARCHRRFHLPTHCPQGHPYDQGNTYVDPRGARRCRTCRLVQKRAQRARGLR